MLSLALPLAALLSLAHAQQMAGPRIVFNSTLANCLGVHSPANDAPVELISCYDRSAALDWVFSYPGDNMSMRLNNTNFCLDAGSSPHSGAPAKVYTCYPGLAAQNWYYTLDLRIALVGDAHQCLDFDGTKGTRAVQTWACTDNDRNQMWGPDARPYSL